MDDDRQAPGLDAEAAAFLRSVAGAPRIQDGTPELARSRHEASAMHLAGDGPELARVADEVVAGVPARRYSPAGARGTLVYIHGGGWVVGTLDTYDTLCRLLAAAAGVEVISVSYDLAPEARHPRQLEQVIDVVRTVVANDGAPVSVGGDSAGAYLAAAAAARLHRDGLELAGQLLIYPVVSPALDTPSAIANAEGFFLETAGMRWYWDQYLGGANGTALVAEAGQPPAYVLTAGFDPLHDEGRRYANELTSVGVPVTAVDHEGQIHGFVRFTGIMPAARLALADMGAWIRALPLTDTV